MRRIHLDRVSETNRNFVNRPKCNTVKVSFPYLTCKNITASTALNKIFACFCNSVQVDLAQLEKKVLICTCVLAPPLEVHYSNCGCCYCLSRNAMLQLIQMQVHVCIHENIYVNVMLLMPCQESLAGHVHCSFCVLYGENEHCRLKNIQTAQYLITLIT